MIQESQYRPLGGSGIKVSPLGTGTNRWSQGKNDETVFQAYESLVNAGVNFFDTAEVYSFGKSERLLGACLKRDPRPVVIGTKYAPYRLLARQFIGALDASLSRLGRQTLDLYYIHFPYGLLSIDTLMDLMAEAHKTGKVRAVGVSNCSAKQMRRAATRLRSHGIPLAANQVRYNLLHRQPEENGVLTACRELDVALVAYLPLERRRLLSGAAKGTASEKQGNEAALQKTLRRLQSSTRRVSLRSL